MKFKSFFLVSILFMLLTGNALAGGGLSSLDAEATNFSGWLYGFIGITATIYLLVKGIMVKMQKATWGDFGMAVVWVIILGGIPALSIYGFSILA